MTKVAEQQFLRQLELCIRKAFHIARYVITRAQDKLRSTQLLKRSIDSKTVFLERDDIDSLIEGW